jgi:hypothetical protein
MPHMSLRPPSQPPQGQLPANPHKPGTFKYMAPEVVGGAPYGKAADVFSLCTMVAECIGLEQVHRLGNDGQMWWEHESLQEAQVGTWQGGRRPCWWLWVLQLSS